MAIRGNHLLDELLVLIVTRHSPALLLLFAEGVELPEELGALGLPPGTTAMGERARSEEGRGADGGGRGREDSVAIMGNEGEREPGKRQG